MASKYRCRLFRLTKDKLYAARPCHYCGLDFALGDAVLSKSHIGPVARKWYHPWCAVLVGLIAPSEAIRADPCHALLIREAARMRLEADPETEASA